MAFQTSQKIAVTGFNVTDTQAILEIVQDAYDRSPTFKIMFDKWINLSVNISAQFSIEIRNVQLVDIGFGALAGQGIVNVDLRYLSLKPTYIDKNGLAVEDNLTSALLHELSHALSVFPVLLDNDLRSGLPNSTKDYRGDNVNFVNQIYKELGIPEQVSYVAIDNTGGTIITLGYQYTNGAAIDAAAITQADWDSSDLGNSKDLLIGGSNPNPLFSGTGDDFLFGGGGNDQLNGGDGIDTAVYFGSKLDYDIRKNSDGSWAVKHSRGAKDAGTDTLTNIEFLQFDGLEDKKEVVEIGINKLGFQTDFALVIDTTGSMGSSINSIKAQSAALIDAVFAGGKNDGRIAVVGFKDTVNGEPSEVILSFTDQDEFEDRKTAATAAINRITVGGGGDLPETDFDGLLLALNGSAGQWRVGAGTRRIALFTDAPVKDAELAAQVTAIAQNIGATIASRSSLRSFGGSVDTFNLTFDSLFSEPTAQVQIFTIFTGPSYLDTAPLSAIALDNGGAFLTAPSNDELVRKLLEIINTPPTSSAISISFAENVTDTVYSFNSNPSTGSTLSYSITGTDASTFKIDSTTGAINFKTSPNFESPTDSGADNIYNINVAASDGTSTNNQSLTITVTDVNEAPIITSGSNANFAENGMGVVYTVTATDPDAGTSLNYSITGTDASLFNIDRLTGAIAFKSVPDFEYPIDSGANNVYNINAITSDGTLTSSQSLAISVNNINEPLGSNLQWNLEGGEVLDLRFASGLPTNTKSVRADFVVTSGGDFKDFVGFYKVADVNGGIDTNRDGIADLTPGQSGYLQAAISNRVKGMDLTVKSQGKASFTEKFNPNSIFAPFIIANGTLNQLLDRNPANDPAVYFPFLGANSDRSDHVRMLGTNVFGFEDLPYSGDRDFDDIIVKVTLTPVK